MNESSRQLTIRAVIAGMLLGGFMSLSNLYISLKVGWSFGVSITAGILAYAFFEALTAVKLIRTPFGMLENNAMQSVASAAGYMTGGGTVAAIPAMMMITGQSMPPLQMFAWIGAIALLGVVMAIPMKQQMINVEQLAFPTGIAAAETLRALHGAEGESGKNKANYLGLGALMGIVLGILRDVKGSFKQWALPEKLELPLTLAGRPLADFTLSFDLSLIMIGAGAIMGFRAAWSQLLGALLNYGLLAPWLYEQHIIPEKLGYKNIVGWSVWMGSSMLLTSGLLSFAFQWRSVLRAMRSVSAAFQGGSGDGEVPMSWFLAGMALFGPLVVGLEWAFFGIAPWMGVLSVLLGFFTAIVACRVTGETDTTPTGALGKITQITFGWLAPGNTITNLMTANVTGGIGLHAADLLTDLKSGFLLKADPRQQFWAQFFGVLAGSVAVVGAYGILVPTAADLGTDRWPAPAAQTWKGVAEMLAKGLDSMHPTAQAALAIGAAIGVGLVLLERLLPNHKRFIPSPAGLGLAFTTPAYNTLSMFIGALMALGLERSSKHWSNQLTVPLSSGWIAGESLLGVAVAMGVWAGWLEG